MEALGGKTVCHEREEGKGKRQVSGRQEEVPQMEEDQLDIDTQQIVILCVVDMTSFV